MTETDYNNLAIETNKRWIASGKIGCVFASVLVKQAESIGWYFVANPEQLEIPSPDTHILSIVFPKGDIHSVKVWALVNGMYLENIDDMHQGLRIDLWEKHGIRAGWQYHTRNISWVQYFGPDSHVKTRQAPFSMLTFCVKLPAKYYAKVGRNGILHLAHAGVQNISERVQDKLWKNSFKKTADHLGHKPGISEAAKTTYKS